MDRIFLTNKAFFSGTAECFRDLERGKEVLAKGDVDIEFTKGLLKSSQQHEHQLDAVP